MPPSLTHEIFDPTRARSLKSANSAFGVGQCLFATFVAASFASIGQTLPAGASEELRHRTGPRYESTGAQKFRNVSSEDILSLNHIQEK